MLHRQGHAVRVAACRLGHRQGACALAQKPGGRAARRWRQLCRRAGQWPAHRDPVRPIAGQRHHRHRPLSAARARPASAARRRMRAGARSARQRRTRCPTARCRAKYPPPRCRANHPPTPPPGPAPPIPRPGAPAMAPPQGAATAAMPAPAAPARAATDAAPSPAAERLAARADAPMRALEFEWRKRLHAKLIEAMDLRRHDVSRMSDEHLRAEADRLIVKIMQDMASDIPAALEHGALRKQILDEAVGLGPLEELLADDSVTEVMVNRFGEIYIERAGRLQKHALSLTSDQAVMGVIERIVAPLGRRIDESSPMVDARLKDGSRVNAIIAPLALKGSTLT